MKQMFGLGPCRWWAVMMLGWAAPLQANEIQAAYDKGRALFNAGDFAQAKPYLERVAAASPDHATTQAMLARVRIMTAAKPNLESRYAKVLLPQVDFSEVTLTEALEGLRLLAKGASEGAVIPNFIVRNGENLSRTFSIQMSNVPLTTAIDYVAQMSGAMRRYEQHAVVFSPKGG